MKKKLLFLDADLRSTLSLIRSIGELDQFNIILAGQSRFDLCRFSKFSNRFYIYYPPHKNHTAFIENLQQIIKNIKPDYIVPCSDRTLYSIYSSSIYDEIKPILLAPNKEEYLYAFDKRRMNHLINSCGIKIIDEISVQDDILPIVIKPRQSKYIINNQLINGYRKIVFSKEDFTLALEEIKKFDDAPLIQKQIKGKGYGIFIAAKEGKIFSSFAHERIREVPLSGGFSTFRRSIGVDSQLLQAISKIVRTLKWTGIMMVEFKGTFEGDIRFMEVNGRPWGSIDLAVTAGVDFPKMLIDLYIYQLSYEELRKKYNVSYVHNYYSRWIIGEIKYLLSLLSTRLPIKKKFKMLQQLIFYKSPLISYDTYRTSDPMPFIMEVFVSGITHLKLGISRIFKFVYLRVFIRSHMGDSDK